MYRLQLINQLAITFSEIDDDFMTFLLFPSTSEELEEDANEVEEEEDDEELPELELELDDDLELLPGLEELLLLSLLLRGGAHDNFA